MIRCRVYALSFFLLWTAKAGAEWHLRTNLELIPQYRILNQTPPPTPDGLFDMFALVSTHLEVASGGWFFEMKPEVRAMASRGMNDYPPPDRAVKTTPRFLDSRRTLAFNSDNEAYFDFDRLNLRYSFGEGEVYAGRRPLSMGVLRLFPVWNKITLPLLFEPGPEWIENPDVFGGSYQVGKVAFRIFGARMDQPENVENRSADNNIALAEVRFFGTGYEIQFLGGEWWEHSSAGVAGSVDVADMTFRMESIWFSRYREEPSQAQIGLGLETALGSKWTLVTEALYQSAGLDDMKNVYRIPNRFMVLSGRYYLMPYATYQMNNLWGFQLGALANADSEPTFIGIGGFEYSLGDDTTLSFRAKIPFGQDTGEFGARRVTDIYGQQAGLSTTYYLRLTTTF